MERTILMQIKTFQSFFFPLLLWRKGRLLASGLDGDGLGWDEVKDQVLQIVKNNVKIIKIFEDEEDVPHLKTPSDVATLCSTLKANLCVGLLMGIMSMHQVITGVFWCLKSPWFQLSFEFKWAGLHLNFFKIWDRPVCENII